MYLGCGGGCRWEELYPENGRCSSGLVKDRCGGAASSCTGMPTFYPLLQP